MVGKTPCQPVKCTLSSFGTFSTPSFAGVGEPYDDRLKSAPPRSAARPPRALSLHVAALAEGPVLI